MLPVEEIKSYLPTTAAAGIPTANVLFDLGQENISDPKLLRPAPGFRKTLNIEDLNAKIRDDGLEMEVLTHKWQVPGWDALQLSSYIYWQLRAVADKYQREHQDAFFEAMPQLLLGDYEDSTSYLRTNYRKYCARASEKLAMYLTLRNYYDAALCNLLVWSRYEGFKMSNDIARNTRWALINGKTKMFGSFPATKMQKAIVNMMNIAAGYNEVKELVVSFPQYIVSPRGTTCSMSAPLLSTVADGNADTNFGLQEQAFADAVYAVSSQYDGVFSLGANNPLNGPRLVNEEATTALPLFKDVAAGAQKDFANFGGFVNNLWHDFFVIQDMLAADYYQFMAPNSDWYNIAFALQLVEISYTANQVKNQIWDNPMIDIVDLAERLRFSPTAEPVAAVKDFFPITASGAEFATPSAVVINTETLVNTNFDKFKLATEDSSIIMRAASVVPGTHIVLEPFINTVGSTAGYNTVEEAIDAGDYDAISVVWANAAYGGNRSEEGLVDNDRILPWGATVALLQASCTTSPNPADDSLQVLNLEDGIMERLHTDYTMYSEKPNIMFKAIRGFHNPSDPYQCGFNLFLSREDGPISLWEKWLTDPNSYGVYASGLELSDPTAVSDGFIYDSTLNGATGTSAIAFSLDDGADLRYAEVFLGLSPLLHPSNALLNINRGEQSVYSSSSRNLLEGTLEGIGVSRYKAHLNAAYAWQTDTEDFNFTGYNSIIMLTQTSGPIVLNMETVPYLMDEAHAINWHVPNFDARDSEDDSARPVIGFSSETGAMRTSTGYFGTRLKNLYHKVLNTTMALNYTLAVDAYGSVVPERQLGFLHNYNYLHWLLGTAKVVNMGNKPSKSVWDKSQGLPLSIDTWGVKTVTMAVKGQVPFTPSRTLTKRFDTKDAPTVVRIPKVQSSKSIKIGDGDQPSVMPPAADISTADPGRIAGKVQE